jgi:hypothetical protein
LHIVKDVSREGLTRQQEALTRHERLSNVFAIYTNMVLLITDDLQYGKGLRFGKPTAGEDIGSVRDVGRLSQTAFS